MVIVIVNVIFNEMRNAKCKTNCHVDRTLSVECEIDDGIEPECVERLNDFIDVF